MGTSRQRATRLISELYGDWLGTLTDSDFQAEVRQLDKRTGLVSATKELLEIRQQMRRENQ